jgi:hypothetical protein
MSGITEIEEPIEGEFEYSCVQDDGPRRLGVIVRNKDGGDIYERLEFFGEDSEFNTFIKAYTENNADDLVEKRKIRPVKDESQIIQPWQPLGICEAALKKDRKGKWIRGSTKALATVLDILTFPISESRGRSVHSGYMLVFGPMFVLGSPMFFMLLDYFQNMIIIEIPLVNIILSWLGPFLATIFFFTGWLLTLGGIKLTNRMSFNEYFTGRFYGFPPAYDSNPIFGLGDVTVTLKDLHTNVIAFGGIGTGKTAAFIYRILFQLFNRLKHPDHQRADAALGALILDVKGDFVDFVIYCLRLVGRPLSDLVIVDPDLDLFRYNPLDPEEENFAEMAAEKLASVQKLMSGDGGGDNKYWDDTSKMVVELILKVLTIVKAKRKIGLDDVARYSQDDAKVEMLIEDARAKLEVSKADIPEEQYYQFLSAVDSLQNQWVGLAENTKSILKTTIANLLGPLARSPQLQKCFCRDTNFGFKDVVNKGKIVLFRARTLDASTKKMIAVCLKKDFQTWVRRREGSTASAYGLNTERTCVFVCDEYQEFVTCGGEGDEAFFGLSRSAKCCGILATQQFNSLLTSIGKEDQVETLLANICTKIFLRTTDKKTMEYGELLSGYIKREKVSTNVSRANSTKLFGNDSGGKDSSFNVSEDWEPKFRKEEFSNLMTVDMEKIKGPMKRNRKTKKLEIDVPNVKGVWYSEAIVYHYNEYRALYSDPTRSRKTRLWHFYGPRKEMAQTSAALDTLLYDRNAQRQIHQQFYYLSSAIQAHYNQAVLDVETARQRVQYDKTRRRQGVTIESDSMSSEEREVLLLEEVKQLELDLAGAKDPNQILFFESEIKTKRTAINNLKLQSIKTNVTCYDEDSFDEELFSSLGVEDEDEDSTSDLASSLSDTESGLDVDTDWDAVGELDSDLDDSLDIGDGNFPDSEFEDLADGDDGQGDLIE